VRMEEHRPVIHEGVRMKARATGRRSVLKSHA
jgi:hypothetical protein